MISNRNKRSAIGSSIVAVILGVVLATATWAGGGRVLHKVSVGGPDSDLFGGPGSDANFSLNAIQFDDMTVNGQYTDQFGHGNGGFHAVIDCLYVNGNEAWVSGIITHGSSLGEDFTGLPVATRVVDNGKSGDQISYSWIGDDRPCTDMVLYDLLDMPKGQVKVR